MEISLLYLLERLQIVQEFDILPHVERLGLAVRLQGSPDLVIIVY